jgi:VWFA-related protein
MKLLLALALSTVVATPPQQPKPLPYLESIEVTVNNVDVIVTDRAGHRVHGLRQSDFELLENNVPQAISNFSEYRGAERAPVATSEPESTPQPRKFVMLFDDLSLHPATAGEFRRRTDELVEAAMQPGDEMMVVTPVDKKTKVALPFTSDKRAIHNAVEAVMRRSAFHADNALVLEQMFLERDVQQSPQSAQRAGAQAYARGVSRRVKETLGHLQGLVAGLADVPGKKSVIFVTQSLPIEPGFEAFDQDMPLPGTWATLRTYLKDIARVASTNGVTVYCLQPDVPLGPSVGIDVEDRGRSRMFQRVAGRSPLVSTQGTQEAFELLSNTTGGKWWRGGAGIKPLFQQVTDDVTDYYSIGYRAATEEPDRTRAIVVHVRDHPEYDVRSRHAVVRKSPVNEMRDMVIARLLDDRAVDELNVRVSVGEIERERTGSRLVPVSINVPLSKLTFLRDGDVYRATFRVHYAAESSSALDFAPGEGREQVVEVPIADMPHIGGKYFTYTSSLRVLPGDVKVSVGVLDPLSHLATIKTMTVAAR